MAKNNSKIAEAVFKEVYSYCKNKGYISQLNKSLKTPEGERFDKKNISDIGLDVLDAVHCVVDKKRSMFFLNEIVNNIQQNDFVVEAGIGTGLLSLAAAKKGAQVVGIEINKNIFTLAKEIKKNTGKKLGLKDHSVRFLRSDALKYVPDKKADMIISENIYTGMFYEKQIQIMNYLRKYLKKDGIVVPFGLKIGLSVAEAVFPADSKPGDLFVPLQLGNKFKFKVLSEDVVYSNLDFSKENKILVDKEIELNILDSGVINGILVWTEVLIGDKIIGRYDTTFLNNDIVIVSSFLKKVSKNDKIKMRIKYKFGSKPKDASFVLLDN